MYDLKKTYVKSNFQWEEKDVSLETIETVRKYQNVRITTQWEDELEQDFFSVGNMDAFYKAPKDTLLKDWIKTLYEGDLNLTDKARGLSDSNAVDFVDLSYVSTNVGSGNYLYGEGVSIPEGLDTDIKFSTIYTTSEKYHIDKLETHCLYAVNGIIYPSVKRGEYIFILNGNERLKYDSDQTVSVIDFSDIGSIEKVAVNADNVSSIKQNENDLVLNQSRFKISLGMELNGKIPLLVMDGYLHILDGVLEQVDKEDMLITVSHGLALKRCAKKPRYSRDWIDFANIEESGFNIASFSAEKYLHSKNTFIVLVDCEDFSMFKEPIGKTDIPGVFHHYRAPRGMLFFDDGRLAPYYIKDYNSYECALYTINGINSLHTDDVSSLNGNKAYGINTYTERPVRAHSAKLVELYSFA